MILFQIHQSSLSLNAGSRLPLAGCLGRSNAVFFDRLIDAVLGPYLTGNSTLLFVSTDNPMDFVYYEIDVHAAGTSAFAHRPDLLAARQEIDRREYGVKRAKNQRLPQFDANARGQLPDAEERGFVRDGDHVATAGRIQPHRGCPGLDETMIC